MSLLLKDNDAITHLSL
jgi:malate dehydrogenase